MYTKYYVYSIALQETEQQYVAGKRGLLRASQNIGELFLFCEDYSNCCIAGRMKYVERPLMLFTSCA